MNRQFTGYLIFVVLLALGIAALLVYQDPRLSEVPAEGDLVEFPSGSRLFLLKIDTEFEPGSTWYHLGFNPGPESSACLLVGGMRFKVVRKAAQ